jgi:hypothetical protein
VPGVGATPPFRLPRRLEAALVAPTPGLPLILCATKVGPNQVRGRGRGWYLT